MALTNIEYGSLASSEIMNKNFMYLDDKISESTSSIMTSISSILSNIATINSRLSDLSENVSDYVEEYNLELDEYKEKTKLLVNMATMIPNWAGCYALSFTGSFEAPSNGYLLLLPESSASGNISVNSIVSLVIKKRSNSYDNAAQLITIPLQKGDVASSSVAFAAAYFLPTANVNIENF